MSGEAFSVPDWLVGDDHTKQQRQQQQSHVADPWIADQFVSTGAFCATVLQPKSDRSARGRRTQLAKRTESPRSPVAASVEDRRPAVQVGGTDGTAVGDGAAVESSLRSPVAQACHDPVEGLSSVCEKGAPSGSEGVECAGVDMTEEPLSYDLTFDTDTDMPLVDESPPTPPSPPAPPLTTTTTATTTVQSASLMNRFDHPVTDRLISRHLPLTRHRSLPAVYGLRAIVPLAEQQTTTTAALIITDSLHFCLHLWGVCRVRVVHGTVCIHGATFSATATAAATAPAPATATIDGTPPPPPLYTPLYSVALKSLPALCSLPLSEPPPPPPAATTAAAAAAAAGTYYCQHSSLHDATKSAHTANAAAPTATATSATDAAAIDPAHSSSSNSRSSSDNTADTPLQCHGDVKNNNNSSSSNSRQIVTNVLHQLASEGLYVASQAVCFSSSSSNRGTKRNNSSSNSRGTNTNNNISGMLCDTAAAAAATTADLTVHQGVETVLQMVTPTVACSTATADAATARGDASDAAGGGSSPDNFCIIVIRCLDSHVINRLSVGHTNVFIPSQEQLTAAAAAAAAADGGDSPWQLPPALGCVLISDFRQLQLMQLPVQLFCTDHRWFSVARQLTHYQRDSGGVRAVLAGGKGVGKSSLLCFVLNYFLTNRGACTALASSSTVTATSPTTATSSTATSSTVTATSSPISTANTAAFASSTSNDVGGGEHPTAATTTGAAANNNNNDAHHHANSNHRGITADDEDGGACARAVYVLDLDPGQSEFTPCACVSLVCVTDCCLGPSFTHLCRPVRSVYTGVVSVADDPAGYLRAIRHVLRHFDSLFTPPPAAAAGGGGDVQRCQRVSSAPPPLLINTMGWANGLGEDLLAEILCLVRPTHLVELVHPYKPAYNFSARLTHENLAARGRQPILARALQQQQHQQQQQLSPHCSVSEQRPPLAPYSYEQVVSRRYAGGAGGGGGGSSATPSLTPWMLRNLNTTAYLASLETAQLGLFQLTPRRVPWSMLAVQISGTRVHYEHVMAALNGAPVALATTDPATWPARPAPDLFSHLAPDYSHTVVCHGFGFVRGVDVATRSLYIVTDLTLQQLRSAEGVNGAKGVNTVLRGPHHLLPVFETHTGSENIGRDNTGSDSRMQGLHERNGCRGSKPIRFRMRPMDSHDVRHKPHYVRPYRPQQ